MRSLSPSRMKTWRQCPRLYYWRHVEDRPVPVTPDQARGTLVHQVLEDIYSLAPPGRTLAAALAHVPDAWRTVRAGRRGTVPRWAGSPHG